ncbi:hypothetical protein [Salmonirosea aquatica]|uniref:Type 1 periplasmic binding fold superfamily protein n=1 Tax=Salmonirosea aquatica TaxID=2654236 RepID=A0A7C9FA36_9BACT|nr:hypothetical protein [Cytophagaceae bacterium SJW1-29]
MAMKNKWIPAMLIGLTFLLAQCKSASDVEPDDENELITTVQLQFSPTLIFTGDQTFTYRDIDGDGGNPPTKFDTISLLANTEYVLKVTVLDESKNPADDITEEVQEKADEHLFVFTPTPASLLTYTYGDKDARNLPIGLVGTVKTGAAGTGTLRVQLRHQPPISDKIMKDGTAGPGSDDVNLNFNLVVK